MPERETMLTPRFVLVVTVGLAYFLSLGLVLPVVPQFVEYELRGGSVAVGVAVGAFAVGAVLLRPIAGRIGDRTGRKVLIVGGAVVVAIAVAGYVVASSLGALLPARLLGGIGEAAFFVGAGTMITDLAPEARRGEAISYWSVAVYGGLAFGPFLGEIILHRWGYDTVWIVAALLALSAALLSLLTEETTTPETRAAATAHGSQPLLHRGALAPGLILFLGLISLAGFAGFLPLYVEEIGVGDSGGVFLLYGCVVLVVRIFGAKIPDRIGPLRAGSLALVGTAIGMAVIALVHNAIGLYGGTVLFALGMSTMYPAMLLLALTDVPANERSSALGTVSSFFDLSQGLGAVLLGVVAALTSYRGSFIAAALLCLVGLVLLRSGIDPRVRRPVDHEAAALALETLEPDPP